MATRMFNRLGSSVRRFATTAIEGDFKRTLLEEEAHAGGTWVTWRRISFLVAIPAVLVCAWSTYEKEKEHATHGRADFVGYPHLRQRKKPFPWGDGNRSLFHNAHTNALPEGYEDAAHEEE